MQIEIPELLSEINLQLKSMLDKRSDAIPLFRQLVNDHYRWSFDHDKAPHSDGKKIRPLMTVLAARAVRGEHHHVLLPALCLEIIHDFSIILDDVMDQDELRRHRPTLWTQWGSSLATTTGTGIYTLAFSELLTFLRAMDDAERAYQAIDAIMEACMEIHNAQLYDLHFEATFDVELSQCLMVAAGRSSLITCGAKVGAMLSTHDQGVIDNYHRFGHCFAIAFSLLDDYQDIWGEEDSIGKPIASDIRQKKKSYPVMAGYYALSQENRNLLEELYKKEQLLDADVQTVKQMLSDSGAAEKTLQRINEYYQQACTALEATGICTPGQDQLKALTDNALGTGLDL